MRRRLVSLFALMAMVMVGFAQQNPAGTVVYEHGLLQAKSSKIVDQMNEPVSFAGMSLFWSQWAGGFYNDDCIHWLVKDWKCNIIRAAMAIESDGYLANPAFEKAKIETVVNACIREGIYVIIDWHDHNAQNHKAQALAFFKEMATKYGNYPNVIYEIFNEPLQVSWSSVIKPYAVEVVNAIRAIDPDNLILVGNSSWDQQPLDCANDPIKDVNIAYTFHFYVGQHATSMASNAISAMKKGVAVFVSEWGLWGSDADLDTWIKFMKDNQISNCNWSINTKVEPSSALMLGASEKGNWSPSQLTDIGLKVRKNIQSWGPKPKEIPSLMYASTALPSNEVILQFSNKLNISKLHNSDFSLLQNEDTFDVESVKITDSDSSRFSLYLKQSISAISKEAIELSYIGDSVFATNGIKLPKFDNFRVNVDSVGASPYPVAVQCDSFGKFINLQFNKKILNNGSGFQVKSNSKSILDSVLINTSDSSQIRLFTQRYYQDEMLALSYLPGDIKATDGGVLSSFSLSSFKNIAFPAAPKIMNVNLTTYNSILVTFDKPVKITSLHNSGFRIMIVDTLGNQKMAEILSTESNQYTITIKLNTSISSTNSVFFYYNNGAILGLDSPYSIEEIDSLLLKNSIAPVIKISKIGVTRIEAENYAEMSGIQTENTTDAGAGQNVGYIESNDWIDYRVNVVDTGTYSVTFRTAAESAKGTVVIKQSGADLVSLSLPVSGGWQIWKSVSANVTFATAGEQTIRIFAKVGGWNFNWFELGSPLTSINSSGLGSFNIYPTVVSQREIFIQSNINASNDVNIQLYSLTGNLLYSSQLLNCNEKASIKLPSSIKTGMYLITASESGAIVYRNKIVVVR